MKYASLLIITFGFSILLSFDTIAQSTTQTEWHAAGDSLRIPDRSDNFFPSMLSFVQYDSVAIVYQTGDNEMHKGFKRIRLKHGYYTDDAYTLQVFFDEQFRRITNVVRYRFL